MRLEVHTAPEEFEYRGSVYSDKASNVSVHTMPETFQNATITDRFGVFRPNINVKLVFSISSDLKSVSEKLPFRDGLA